MLKVGIDGGNNTIITTLDGMNPLIIPTILSPWKDYNSQGPEVKKRSLKEMIDVEIELNYKNTTTKKNLGRFLVGDIAKKEGENIRIRNIGKNKKGDENLLICMLSSLAVAVVEEQQKYQGCVTQEVKLVTGLPFIQYREDKDDYKQQFLGTHRVSFKGFYNIDVELIVSHAYVELEGAGALNKIIFQGDDYIYPAETLVDRIILGVEIGEFTTELIALTFVEEDGLIVPEFKRRICSGFDIGIATSKQPIIDFLREEHKTIKDRYDIDNALKLPGSRKGLIDCNDGHKVDIKSMYENQLYELSQELASRINDKINNSNEKGKIIHTLLLGGGACVFDYKLGNFLMDFIKNVLGGESTISANQHLANAEGYLEKSKLVFED